MKKKVLIVICMLILTIIGLFYVDFVCADSYVESEDVLEYVEINYVELDDIIIEDIIIRSSLDTSNFLEEEVNHSIVETDDINTLKELKKECQIKMEAAHDLAQAARTLGYKENHPVIVLAGKEWTVWNFSWKYYDEQIKKLEVSNIEYPVAHAVWCAFKEKGYTNESIAAIIGNMMKECGGHTLSLDYKAYNGNGGYYGLCQWSKKYYPEVLNSSLDFQIDWLSKTIMSDFYKETDIKNAAIRFAREYERCSSSSYNKRAELAKIAYDYFTENFE